MSAPLRPAPLPAPLQPLATELAALDPAVVAALMPVLLRTLAVVSTTAPPSSDDDGEPDGYCGFARRGPWDRLLMSEWALLDEVPDEFLRRVAMREQLFHELERTSTRQPGVVVALFDVGGDQLGRPKLVQLAVAIVLAARARAANATFVFGTLAPQTALVSWSAPALLHLRDSRARGAATADDVRRARRAVEALVVAPGSTREVVIVGGRKTARDAWPDALHVILDDVLEPGVRAVALQIARQGTTTRTATLPLPDDATCTRLVRDPLERRRPKPKTAAATAAAPVRKRTKRVRFRKGDDTAIDVTQPLQMSADGFRVLARLVGGAVLSMGLPHRAPRSSADLSWGRSLAVPGRVIAAGATGTQLWAITIDDDAGSDGGCDVHTGNHGTIHLRGAVRPTPRADGSFGIAAQHVNATTRQTSFFFVDAERRLFQCDMHHGVLRLVADNATLLYSDTHTVRYATEQVVDGGCDVEVVVVSATGARDVVFRNTVPAPPTKLVDVGHAVVRVLCHLKDRRWRLWSIGAPGPSGTRIALPTTEVDLDVDAAQVLGVVAIHDRFVAVTAMSNGVVVHDEQRRDIDGIVRACVARETRIPMVVTLDDEGNVIGHPLHHAAARWAIRHPKVP